MQPLYVKKEKKKEKSEQLRTQANEGGLCYGNRYGRRRNKKGSVKMMDILHLNFGRTLTWLLRLVISDASRRKIHMANVCQA